MSIGEEQTECPLCMEPLEMDDINFFPCTCGYQICRFCWHRIRTDENGLCPACRKHYPEDPAEFKPLTEDELQRIKKERRQKDLQRKQKAAENRKHLANVRVVQRNLVFVVGLSQRLADTEVLKKHEYFGKFGKIHKVVINQSTSYAGSQGPSASAYVTYLRTEDALRAIQAVNNVYIDGRTLKASLGTTKYCSHFLKGSQCPKPDCMYLHELGEEAASFTKEEMQQGKHTDYEHRLMDQLLTPTPVTASPAPGSGVSGIGKPPAQPPVAKKKESPPVTPDISQVPPNTTNRDAWPSLSSGNGKTDTTRLTNGNRAPQPPSLMQQTQQNIQNLQNRAPGTNRHRTNTEDDSQHRSSTEDSPSHLSPPHTVMPPQQQPTLSNKTISPPCTNNIGSNMRQKFPFQTSDPLSLFSNSGYSGAIKPLIQPPMAPTVDIPTTEIAESIPVSSSTDWQAAFGFAPKKETVSNADDDLGFDPWEESSKVLSEIMENETVINQHNVVNNKPTGLPPGFTPNHIPNLSATHRTDSLHSNMLGLMGMPEGGLMAGNGLPEGSHTHLHNKQQNVNLNQNTDPFKVKDWQEGLRALLPNINISFGTPPVQQQQHQQQQQNNQHIHSMQQQKNWSNTNNISVGLNDPAIVTSAMTPDSNHPSDSDPHWMRSLQQLTELDSAPTNHSRLPFVQQFQQFTAPQSWSPLQNPPPGFQAPIRPQGHTEQRPITEGLQ
ncbi:unnamed protein product [Owenia fusiformis]|uniref:CCR4-NOT transcription complex subunit 4 n=1 Tax=Owenia fusiformis TaxID=6347 RepID=A0A8J1XW52_OWEFU|nr:unnamed protein product [Owenia fusiformis]